MKGKHGIAHRQVHLGSTLVEMNRLMCLGIGTVVIESVDAANGSIKGFEVGLYTYNSAECLEVKN